MGIYVCALESDSTKSV